MLAVAPVAVSLLLLTFRGNLACTTSTMVSLSVGIWVVPALYLGSWTIVGVVKPGSFVVVHANDSRHCDWGGEDYQWYVLGESILFFYLPAALCLGIHLVVGFFTLRHQAVGVSRLVRRGLWIIFFFCLCWVPFMVVEILSQHGYLERSLLLYTYLFFYLSVIINPLVFVLTSRPFRVRLLRILDSRPFTPRHASSGLIHVNDRADFEIGRGQGALVETTSGMEEAVDMKDDSESTDDEMVDVD